MWWATLLGSAAAIAAALVILWTGWTRIDPLLSVLVAESGHILLEAAPRGVDVRELEADLTATVAGVAGVYHIHAWSLSEDRRMATLHVKVTDLPTPPASPPPSRPACTTASPSRRDGGGGG